MNSITLLDKLFENKSLSLDEYKFLVENYNESNARYAATLAVKRRKEIYSNSVFIRGLIEISNICKNDCYYCGIRCSNKNVDRFRLNKEDILSSCDKGYSLGFRTFVMQGGEDPYFTDEVMCDIVKSIKEKYPDCAVTLSLGERSKESYQKLFDSGADRYLLRHETADCEHYAKLHPESLTLENRMQCLKDLRKIGFQVGCGFMVGSPYQTGEHIAKDLKFIENFKPDMCGIGPFIPHKDTPFKDFSSGSVSLTCYLLSVIRLIHPRVLLPATTALGTLMDKGREMGILSGANVVMPNLSPEDTRKKYELYNNKLSTGAESANGLEALRKNLDEIGYEIEIGRGDIRKEDIYEQL